MLIKIFKRYYRDPARSSARLNTSAAGIADDVTFPEVTINDESFSHRDYPEISKRDLSLSLSTTGRISSVN